MSAQSVHEQFYKCIRILDGLKLYSILLIYSYDLIQLNVI